MTGAFINLTLTFQYANGRKASQALHIAFVGFRHPSYCCRQKQWGIGQQTKKNLYESTTSNINFKNEFIKSRTKTQWDIKGICKQSKLSCIGKRRRKHNTKTPEIRTRC